MSAAERIRIFLFKHFFSFLSGATFSDWMKLLVKHRFAIAPRYWPRAVLITIGTIPSSVNYWRQKKKCERDFNSVNVEAPLFILGHWRHGTTHLHKLLSLDRQFAYPLLYDICYPHSPLCGEKTTSGLMSCMLPKRRLQDDIRLSMLDPQEDETALCLTTYCSPFMSWVFPQQADYYDRYLTFRNVDEDEVEHWKGTFLMYLKKLTLKYERPLVLKSPPHTCRIRLLLELFPDARFVHIARNPYAVFRSTLHLEKTAILGMHLQRPRWEHLEERIVERYSEMYDAFFEERELIPAGQLHGMRFEDLERKPVEELERMYDRLSLNGFHECVPALHKYVASLEGYAKNRYEDVPKDTREMISGAWRRSFEEWGYPF